MFISIARTAPVESPTALMNLESSLPATGEGGSHLLGHLKGALQLGHNRIVSYAMRLKVIERILSCVPKKFDSLKLLRTASATGCMIVFLRFEVDVQHTLDTLVHLWVDRVIAGMRLRLPFIALTLRMRGGRVTDRCVGARLFIRALVKMGDYSMSVREVHVCS